ncbi:MAG TPA: hypothetical protein VM925_33680 [Labilithrix sp.]|jgi:hypothetical protein|nr:hypothetical protein [Labilithrix sp.]
MLRRTSPALGVSAVLVTVLSACTSGSVATPSAAKGTPPETPAGSGEEIATDAEPEADAGSTPTCSVKIPKKSNCKNDGSWVRGIIRFDAKHLKDVEHPVLRVALRHSFILEKGEDAVGGRLHAWVNVPVTDPAKGEALFALDMCEQATMWSEENGTFHVVVILDEDDDNDLDQAVSLADSLAIGTPGPKELAKLVDVDVSCHAPSPCIEVNLDCTGPACTRIDPIQACTKKTPGCGKSGFCK